MMSTKKGTLATKSLTELVELFSAVKILADYYDNLTRSYMGAYDAEIQALYDNAQEKTLQNNRLLEEIVLNLENKVSEAVGNEKTMA